MDPTKARINEIDFLEFCTRILSIRNKMIDIKLFIANLSNFIDFDIDIISSIVDKIFSPNLQVNISELNALLNIDYINTKELKELYKRSRRTIYRYKEKGKNIVLYPRLEPEEQEALDVFMTQYNKFFTKNYENIFRIEGRK